MSNKPVLWLLSLQNRLLKENSEVLPERSSNESAEEPPTQDQTDGTSDVEAGSKDEDESSLPADTIGLALSGGGIRSAAFSLGVLQAMARAQWLRHVDILSTVSGGGYTGSFVGRFFDQTRAGDGIKGPEGATPEAAQVHVEAELSNPRSLPITWIRRHANYLAPRGIGEQLFNFSTFWRNLISLLTVLILFFLAFFGIAAAITYNTYFVNIVQGFYELSNAICPISMTVPEWISPFWLRLTELCVWLSVVPLALGYWLASQRRYRTFVISYMFLILILAITLLIATGQPVTLVVFIMTILWTIASWWYIDAHEGVGSWDSPWRMALGRNLLTYWLAHFTKVALLLSSMTVVDTLGMWLARQVVIYNYSLYMIAGSVASTIGVLVAFTPVLQTVMWYLTAEGSQKKGILHAILRIPYLPTLFVLAVGILIPLGLISFVVHLTYEVGYAYRVGVSLTIVATVCTLLLGTTESLPFVNRSGPITVYSARLARVFLGAINPERQRHLDGKDVSHVIPGDDTPFDEYKPHEGGGPLHLLNVAVNQTYDVVSKRATSARQSQNLAVGPVGMSISTDWHAVWEKEDDGSETTLRPLVDATSTHPLNSKDHRNVPAESLTLRQWMAISGAAFSPGQGRNTSLAQALLLTMFNIRLGYWWDSTLGFERLANLRTRIDLASRAKAWIARFLKGQSLILAELRGRFAGPWKRYWYLSDGGHFEYSGAYELLRRRVPLIIICDAGADKAQSGEIMADLMRIASIDWGANITDVDDDILATVPEKVRSKLGTLRNLLTDVNGQTKHHAALLRVFYRGEEDAKAWNGRKHSWILYLKASLNGDEPADIQTYHAACPDFPNQSTLDQFFNEEQWESYRKLGEHIGTEVFV